MTRSLQQQNPLLRAGFVLLSIILFATFSAILEILPVVRSMRPVLILGALGLLIVFGTGRFVKVLTTPIGLSIAAFTVWFIICIPFGLWPGGSFKIFTDYWYKAVLIFVMTGGLITTLPQARRIFHTIAYSVGFVAAIGVVRNQGNWGRLSVLGTRFTNANEYAWTLVVGLAFVGYLYIRGTQRQKVTAVILSLIVLLALAKTGSREGALGILILCAYLFWHASAATRAKLALSATVFLVLSMIVLPSSLRQRFTTLGGEYDWSEIHSQRGMAMSSTEAREELLKESLRVSARHPFLGAGPGNFMVAQDQLAQERGGTSHWQVTHNSFTEVSAEMGIPGFVIYITFLYQVFKALKPIIRTKSRSSEWAELRIMALALQALLLAFLAVAFFNSLEFNTDVPILAGVTVALSFIAQRQRAIDRIKAAEVAAAVEPSADVGLEPVPVGQY